MGTAFPTLEDVILRRMERKSPPSLLDDPDYMRRLELEENILYNRQLNKDKPIPEAEPSIFEKIKDVVSPAIEFGERVAAPIVELQRRTGERERAALKDITFQRTPGAGFINNLPTYFDAFLPTLTALGSTAAGGLLSVSNYLNRIGADIAKRGPLPEANFEETVQRMAPQPSDVRDLNRVQQQYTYQPRTDVGKFVTDAGNYATQFISRGADLVEDAAVALGVPQDRARTLGAAAEVAAFYYSDKAFRSARRSMGNKIREFQSNLNQKSVDAAYQNATEILRQTSQEQLSAARNRLVETLQRQVGSERAGLESVDVGLETLKPAETPPALPRAKYSNYLLDQLDVVLDPGSAPDAISDAARNILKLRNIDDISKIEPGLRSLNLPEDIVRDISPVIHETLARDLGLPYAPFTPTQPQRTAVPTLNVPELFTPATNITPQELFGRARGRNLPPQTRLEALRELRTRVDETGLPVEDALIEMGFDYATVQSLGKQLENVSPISRPARSEVTPLESEPAAPIEPTQAAPRSPVENVPLEERVSHRTRTPQQIVSDSLDVLLSDESTLTSRGVALKDLKREALKAAPGNVEKGLRALGVEEEYISDFLPAMRQTVVGRNPAIPPTTETISPLRGVPEPAPVVQPKKSVITFTPDEQIIFDEAFRILADPTVQGINRTDFISNIRGLAERYNVEVKDLPGVTPERLDMLTTSRRVRESEAPVIKNRLYADYLEGATMFENQPNPTLVIGKVLRDKGIELTEAQFVELGNKLKTVPINAESLSAFTESYIQTRSADVATTAAKLNDGDLSNPKKVTQEDRAQYMANQGRMQEAYTYDEMLEALKSGVDISSDLPPAAAKLYSQALQRSLSELETPNRRGLTKILKSLKDILSDERGAIGNIELTARQKQALDELRNDAIRMGKDITRLIRGDPRLDTVTKRVFEEYVRSSNAPPPKPYLELNNMGFDSEASLRGDFVIKRAKGEVEGTYHPEIYYSDWMSVASVDDLIPRERRTNFQKVARPESVQTATRKLLNAEQDAIVHAYRGVEQNRIKDTADYKRAIKRIRRQFSEEQQRAIGADMLLNEGSIDLLIASNIEPRTLTPQEITGAQFVRQVFDELLPRLQEVRKNTGRGPMHEVPDYITHMRAANMDNAFGVNTSIASDAANTIAERYANLKNTPFPFERTRRGGKFPAETNAFDILETYVDYALNQIHLGPFVAKIHELIDTPIIDPSTNKTWNMKSEKPNLYKYMSEWNNYIAGKPQHNIPDPWNALLFNISRSLGNAYIAGNISSAAIQPTSLINTSMKVGYGTTIQSALQYMADLATPGQPLRKFRLENSKSLDVRNPDIFFDEAGAGVLEALVQKIPGLKALGRGMQRSSTVAGTVGTKPLRWLDQAAAEITWDAAYNFAKRTGKTGEDAFNIADDIVTLTQGSALRGERSPVQRTQWGRALTQFQTFAINNYDFLTNEVLGIESKNVSRQQAVRNVMKLIGAGTLLNFLIEDIGGGTSPIPNPPLAMLRNLTTGQEVGQDDMAYLAELVFGSTLGEALKVVPFASSIRSRKGQLGGPIASYITDLGRSAIGQPGTNLPRTVTRGLVPFGLQLDKTLLAPEKKNTQSFKTMEGPRAPR